MRGKLFHDLWSCILWTFSCLNESYSCSSFLSSKVSKGGSLFAWLMVSLVWMERDMFECKRAISINDQHFSKNGAWTPAPMMEESHDNQGPVEFAKGRSVYHTWHPYRTAMDLMHTFVQENSIEFTFAVPNSTSLYAWMASVHTHTHTTCPRTDIQY